MQNNNCVLLKYITKMMPCLSYYEDKLKSLRPSQENKKNEVNNSFIFQVQYIWSTYIQVLLLHLYKLFRLTFFS